MHSASSWRTMDTGYLVDPFQTVRDLGAGWIPRYSVHDPSAYDYALTVTNPITWCLAGHCWQAKARRRKLCRHPPPPPPAMGDRITVFWASWPCGRAGWLALRLIKVGDVETNAGPTTTYKQVLICDIYHKQIHCRKQISIRRDMIEHWVHLRWEGIRQTQYTDTWTCHLHRKSGLTTHTYITLPHPSRPWSKPHTHSSPTPPQPKHRHTSNTPLFP